MNTEKSLTCIFGVVRGPISEGYVSEFCLTKGFVDEDIEIKAMPLGVTRQDHVCVVLWGDKVVSIANMTTGEGVDYRFPYPKGPYWKESVSANQLVWMIISVFGTYMLSVLAGLCLASGAWPQAWSMILFSAIFCFYCFWGMFHRWVVMRHNVRVANDIRSRERSAIVQP